MEMRTEWVAPLIAAVTRAGEQVMAVYRSGGEVTWKADNSPLTEADMVSHRALVSALEALEPTLPILSEESAEIDFDTRRQWEAYWLIDPLDGTKEFIKRNGEFTLNVALVSRGTPVFGVVHAPALPEGPTTWWGSVSTGAFKRAGDGEVISIEARVLPDPEKAAWTVVGSRSHGAETFESFCARLPPHERISMGSSLKLCLVAEGKADLYPRLAPTCEWDTAAAHAVVTAGGGEVLDATSLETLRCNQKESYLNPFFIVCGQRDPRWENALRASLES